MELFYNYGYQVIGMNISPHSINCAKMSAQKNNLDIQDNVGDYIINEFPNHCHLIALIYCDFGVFSTHDRVIL